MGRERCVHSTCRSELPRALSVLPNTAVVAVLRKPIVYCRFCRFESFVEGQRRGIQYERVRSRAKRRVGAIAVPFVAGTEVANDFFRRSGWFTVLADLIVAAHPSNLGRGIKKDL